jgi:hypothetical protein
MSGAHSKPNRFWILGALFVFIVASAIWLLGCGSGAAENAIVMENAKPGDPSWVLENPATQHEIEGYASATSINRGQAISFFVSTQDPSYTIDVYRFGWYTGVGARRMMPTVTQQGQMQPTPAPDPTTGLIECQWKNPYVLNVPGDPQNPINWTSGVYLAKLTGVPSGKQSYIIFVVRDDARPSAYLFHSSVTTFQAYNNWGGKSLYDYNSTGGRAAKVSYNRPYGLGGQPTAASGVGAGEFLTTYVPGVVSPYPTGWEYNMLRFLERNGYDVTYNTDLDLHENPNALLGHNALLTVGHDEYWSWEMRSNVIAARDAGVNLAFFAADVAYWQIRFEPSPITGDPDRTQVCYKDSSDPITGPLETIQWRQLGMPEAAFIGVMYFTDRVNADIQVQNTGNWVFAGTGLNDGDSLTGLLGYEVDQITSSSPSNVVVLANSSTPTPQNANMSVYTAPSGATVFATGSMQWNWGLDDYDTPTLRPSRQSASAEQVTRNILGKIAHR